MDIFKVMERNSEEENIEVLKVAGGDKVGKKKQSTQNQRLKFSKDLE